MLAKASIFLYIVVEKINTYYILRIVLLYAILVKEKSKKIIKGGVYHEMSVLLI